MGPVLNSGFLSMKRLGVLLLPHHRVTPSTFAGTHLYTWVKRSTVRVKCPRPGLEPGPPDPKSSALTMRPPRLPLLAAKVPDTIWAQLGGMGSSPVVLLSSNYSYRRSHARIDYSLEFHLQVKVVIYFINIIPRAVMKQM